MRLVVLDTNVVVSAGIRRHSSSARTVEAAIRDATIQIAVSPTIAAEYRRVSRYSKFAQYNFPPQWLEFLIESALRFPDSAPWPHPIPDPDDGHFLALAHGDGRVAGRREFEALSNGIEGWGRGADASGVCGDAGSGSLIPHSSWRQRGFFAEATEKTPDDLAPPEVDRTSQR